MARRKPLQLHVDAVFVKARVEIDGKLANGRGALQQKVASCEKQYVCGRAAGQVSWWHLLRGARASNVCTQALTNEHIFALAIRVEDIQIQKRIPRTSKDVTSH